MKQDLFIGIPTWNSSLFLEANLKQIRTTCDGLKYTIGILDNCSSDSSVSIARDYGCKVEVHEYLLPDALNRLASWSKAQFTLFMHADTILLNNDWFILCTDKLKGATVLISPQDIGCGPFTRPWGKDKPESSFMLFRTTKLRNLKNIRWVRRFRLKVPLRRINFYSPNVTHYLPDELKQRQMNWQAMKVHTSRHLDEAIYQPEPDAKCWSKELAVLEYGLGNFYSIDGTITHYHNWYERLLDTENMQRKPDQTMIPIDYIVQRTHKFLVDLEARKVSLPDPSVQERFPRILSIDRAAENILS